MGCLFKKKKDDEKIEPTNFENAGHFNGFVLLSEPEWNKKKFLEDFKADWGIELVDEGDAEKPEDDIAIFAHVGELTLMVGFTPVPVPYNEAEQWAQANYRWDKAVDAVKAHKATLIVGVKGSNELMLDKANLYVQAVATALNQEHATGYYDPQIVYEPEWYRKFALAAHEYEAFPSMNLVWFGMYTDRKQAGIYTLGMRRFGKEEMEVLIPSKEMKSISPGDIIEFLSDIVDYVLLEDVTLRDGETIGPTAEEKHSITFGKGVGINGNSFKIGYLND